MSFLDYLRGVRHVFAANRARTFLTLLGIMIGSGTIVVLTGLLKGGKEALLQTSQRANEADLIQVRRDEPPPPQIRRTRRELSHDDAAFLDESPLLEGAEVTSEQTRDTRALYESRKKRVRMVAATPVMLSLNRLTLARGRFVRDADLVERGRVCVVGWEVWRELLDERSSLDGVYVQMAGTEWAVIGVLRPKPPLGGGTEGLWRWDNKVLVPQTTFGAIFDPSHGAARLYVRLKDVDDLAHHLGAVERVVKQTLLRRHLGVENFKVEGEDSAASQGRLIILIIEMLLLSTGLLSLVVGGINIMNIMLVTVTERTREIGIRRAIGASPRAVMAQFLFEAAAIALVGGVVGVAGGAGFSWAATEVLKRTVGAWSLHIEPWAIGLGLALSIGTGIVFGLLPAGGRRRSTRWRRSATSDRG